MSSSRNNDQTHQLLQEILKSLQRIEKLLLENVVSPSQLDSKLEHANDLESTPFDVMELINVLSKKDDNLIPTIKALLTKEGGSAHDIAKITKRSRSRENQHLNKLVELGYVQKKRDGREIRFYLR